MKVLIVVLFFCSGVAFAQQTRLIIVGDVKDSKTGDPLAYATIGVSGAIDQAVSRADGTFELSIPSSSSHDTLKVTYVGYATFTKPVAALASFEHILLEEYTTVLQEVAITHRQLDLREIDRNARIIRDKFYAMSTEVTNIQYNDFLAWLEDYNKTELRKQYDFDLSAYPKSVREFYQQYHKPRDAKFDRKRNAKKDSISSFNNYPAVNISYESAVEYCEWLTERYNESTKKKRFKKVRFRLPTLNEWQIAALGDPKFQSWNLRENTVEVIISKDTMKILTGNREKMKVDDTILYPWYSVYHFRNRVFNQFGCFLGNFKIIATKPCPNEAYAYDGYTMMGPVGTYFPNGMGLLDVVGNVAEMIDEKGKACGGSWNELPKESTIQSVKNFSGPDETVGFRLFMEVIEP